MEKNNTRRLLSLAIAIALAIGMTTGCSRKASKTTRSKTSSGVLASGVSGVSGASGASASGASAASGQGGTANGGSAAGANGGGAAGGVNQKQDSPNLNGTVTFAYSSEDKYEIQDVLAAFHSKYPKITLKSTVFSNPAISQTTKLSAMAAAKNLPDITWGVADFGYIMQQGWAYPIDKLYAADPDKKDCLQMGLSRYTYFGHLYALPFRLQFNSIVLNTDLCDTLNMDPPAYNWTISQFVSMAKKSTTSQYSGINYIFNTAYPTWGLDDKLMNSMLASPYQQYGYNLSNNTINLKANNAWVNSENLVKQLESVPGLVSDEMKDQTLRNQGKEDDYQKKFGKDADAFASGKVLFGNHSTWEYNWLSKEKFQWDFYPVPTQDGIPQRIQTHVDYVMMTTAVNQSNRTPAYQLMKFLSYDKDGCITRMKYAMNESTAKTGSLQLYIPASSNSSVHAYFNGLKVPKGLKYMYNTVAAHPNQSMVADCDKIIPNFWSDITQYRNQASTKIKAGTDPASLVNDLQSKISSAMSATWANFKAKVTKNISTFYQTHPWEK